jgi:hypothetical protein
MRRNSFPSKVAWLLPAVFVLGFSTSRAQITHVDISLPAFDYDVIYLGDFIDISSNKLAKNIPNFSGVITTNDHTSGKIILSAQAEIRLKGDPAPVTLVRAETEPFTVSNGSRSITANDLAGGSPDIVIKGGSDYYENASLRKRLEDYAAKFPTAPVGVYTLMLQAYSVTLDGQKGAMIGSTQKVIDVRNASPGEVQVNLIDPQPGATISTTLPTFSWNCPSPNVTLYVYEKLPIYQSLEEAITGNPYLKQTVSGAQTFTYPANAARRLEQNKTYVWFVQAAVVTNRQTIQRKSEVRMFRIRLDDRESQEVSDVMNNFGSTAAGTFATLQSIGWGPTGTITLDGKSLTLDDLKVLVARLTAQNTQVTIRVE